MKYIRFVPVQIVRHPVTDKELGKVEQNEILLSLTTTPEFLNGLKGIEATELLSSARKALRRQKSSAVDAGYYEVEDAHGKALKNAAEKFEPNETSAEAVHPYLVAVVEQTGEPIGAAARPVAESNGAQAQAS
jgi:hypothetical protein